VNVKENSEFRKVCFKKMLEKIRSELIFPIGMLLIANPIPGANAVKNLRIFIF